MEAFLEAQAVAMALIVLYGLIVSFIESRISSRQKTLPPVGPQLNQFLLHWEKGDLPYYLLECFRDEHEKEISQSGVMEVTTPSSSSIIFGSSKHSLRFYIVAEHETAKRILDDSSTTKWIPGYEHAKNIASGHANLVSEAMNGHRWKHARKATASAFSSAYIGLLIPAMDSVVDEWMETRLQPTSQRGESLDILQDMRSLSIQGILRTSFGYTPTENELQRLLDSINVCNHVYGTDAIPDMFGKKSSWSWSSSSKDASDPQRAREGATFIFEFCTKVLLSYRNTSTQQSHLLIHMIEENQEYQSDTERIADMIAYLMSAEKIAITLSFALYNLAANPYEQDDLRDCLKECDTDDAKRCSPVIRNVVREVLRLHSTVAVGTLRVTGNTDIGVVGSSYIIPKRSIVMIPIFVLLRNENIFEDPDLFDPDRWETASERMMESYVPFAEGPRACQGQALAHAFMNTVLSRLIPRYSFYMTNKGRTQCSFLLSPLDLQLSAYSLKPQPDNDDESYTINNREGKMSASCFSLFRSAVSSTKNAV